MKRSRLIAALLAASMLMESVQVAAMAESVVPETENSFTEETEPDLDSGDDIDPEELLSTLTQEELTEPEVNEEDAAGDEDAENPEVPVKEQSVKNDTEEDVSHLMYWDTEKEQVALLFEAFAQTGSYNYSIQNQKEETVKEGTFEAEDEWVSQDLGNITDYTIADDEIWTVTVSETDGGKWIQGLIVPNADSIEAFSGESLDGAVTLNWTDESDAYNGYEIAAAPVDDPSDVTVYNAGDQTNYTVSALNKGSIYTFTLVPYLEDKEKGTIVYGAAASALAALSADLVVQITYGHCSLKLTWPAVEGADAYVVSRWSEKDMQWTAAGTVSSAEYLAEGLTANQKYRFRVEAMRNNVCIAASEVEPTALASAGNVTGLKAAAGERSVLLSWTALKNANGYNVYIKDTQTGKLTYLGSTSKNSYNATALAYGKKYSFVVRSYRKYTVNNAEVVIFGEYSNVASATPTYIVPGVPGSVKATAGDQCVTLTWTAGKNATGYKIYQYDTSTGKMTQISNTTQKKYTVQNLSNAKKYSFIVTTYRKTYGFYTESGKSPVVSATPKMATVVAPSSVTVSGSGTTQTIKWSAVPKATGYILYSYNWSSGKWVQLAKVVGKTTYTRKNVSASGKNKYMVKTYRVDNGKTYISANGTKKLFFGSSLTKSASSVRPIYYTARTRVSADLFQTRTSTKKVGRISAGVKVTVLYRKDERSQIKMSNGKTYWMSNGRLRYLSQSYTKSDYSTLVKEAYVNNAGYTSSTKYLIWISTYTQRVNIFVKDDVGWKLSKSFRCATGKLSTATAMGTWRIWAHAPNKKYKTSYYNYLSKFNLGNSMHTRVKYYRGGYVDSRLGMPLSNGCVRLEDANAKYIYTQIPTKTTVIVF